MFISPVHDPFTTMVNAQQVVAAKYTYDPFGNILSKAGPLADANAYRLSSQEYHQPSGLSLYLYRAYDPNLQRWLNRDPIGEVGFHLLAEARQALVNRTADDFTERLTILLREPGGPNLYAFNGNDPLDYVDPLGLLKFESCSAAQQAKLTADFNAYCGKLKNSLAGCCKNSTILPKLENICKNSQDFTIKCESSATGKCDGGTCGWSVPGGKTVHFCPGGWNSQTCGPLGCTVMHEFTHIIGHPFEKWPKQVEKCLGCP